MTCLNSLGKLYHKMGDYKAAEPYYIKSVEIRKKALGEEHPDFTSTENSYAYFLAQTNREKEGYEILKRNFIKKSIQINEKTF